MNNFLHLIPAPPATEAETIARLTAELAETQRENAQLELVIDNIIRLIDRKPIRQAAS